MSLLLFLAGIEMTALIIVSATCSAICQIAPWQVANLPCTRPNDDRSRDDITA
jgi:hypothetical protein